MGATPSHFCATGAGEATVRGLDTGNFPVEMVSWEDAVAFCDRLSARPAEKKAKRRYRLPAEAEWEFACRAGTTTPFSCGDTLSPAQANMGGEGAQPELAQALNRTCAVGSYAPNAWGVYDMHGQVWEWCRDWYDSSYPQRSRRLDPPGPRSGTARAARGGSWNRTPEACRSACRAWDDVDARDPVSGFRVVCIHRP
jgi:formylglycine-generating enzyme required for sulfatase activity